MMGSYRVWPDGTAQDLEDGAEPYSWLSDDFRIVEADSEESAQLISEETDRRALTSD